MKGKKWKKKEKQTKLTCWVQAFCSHSWPATGNPGAPLNWTESPGVAHWPAGMEGAHWWALQRGRLYYPVLGVGVCPPPGLKWLTGEQLLLPLKDKNRQIFFKPRWTIIVTFIANISSIIYSLKWSNQPWLSFSSGPVLMYFSLSFLSPSDGEVCGKKFVLNSTQAG